MAYYAALVSLVELLKEISLSEHQYPKSIFEEQQITRLYETFSHLQELLEDYSPNDKEAAVFLDRIRDAACLAQDLIECQIPDADCRAREIIEPCLPDSACGEGEIVEFQLPTARDNFESQTPNAAYRAEHTDIFHIPAAVYRAKSVVESEISDRICEPNCLAEIIRIAFWHFVSACHSSENVDELVVFVITEGYRALLKLTKQLGFILSEGYPHLRTLVEEDYSINTAKGYLGLVKLKEEIDSVVLKGYQDLLKLKKELDASGGKGYQNWRVREVVDSIVGRGNQDLDRVKEQVDVIVGKGYNYALEKIKEVVNSIMRTGREDIERMKKEVDSIVGRGYRDRKRLKEEVDSVVVKGYQDLMKLKKELGAVARRGNQNMKKVKGEVDSIVERGYQGFERMKKEVDSVVEKIYEDHLGKKVVDSVVGRGYKVLERVKEEMHSIVGRGYHDWERVKGELDSLVIKGCKEFVKLKKELDAIREKGNSDLKWVRTRVFDFIMGRGYQDLERVKEKVDFTVEKGYKDIIEKVKEEVDSIVEGVTRVKEKSHTTHQDDLQLSVGASKQGSSDATRMVGFEEHLKRIKGQLFGLSSCLQLISIVGMGGIGKTTLARNVFDDDNINNHFNFRVWVTVSQNYHFPNILLAIAKSLNISNEELRGVEDGVLGRCIYQHLFGQRYLIIMDDVWDPKIWEDVKWIFPKKGGSRGWVLITTRQSDVASLARPLDFINQIPVLEYDKSWDLFCEKLLCPPKLEDIGRTIVRYCGGLPLAIVVVAGLLSKVNTTRSDWEKVARDMSSTAAKNDEHFSKIFSLSYNYLPHHLKPCFLYFGGFPEDYEFSTSKLIKLWVAEGFLKPIPSKGLEEVAEEYLEELVRRNLVSVTKRRSNGQFKCCSIHDLLRDLCSDRAYHEHFLFLQHKHMAKEHIHRIFIHPNSSSDIYMQEKNLLVRSILSFGRKPCYFSSQPSNFKPLRVLDAPYININFLPGGVYELLHLRYLVLFICSKLSIPSSIFKLQHLQTFIVVSSRRQTFSLPSEIWKMPRLEHVMSDKLQLPPNVDVERNIHDRVSSLGALQTLSTLVDFKFNQETVQMMPNIKKLKLQFSLYEHGENAWEKFGIKNFFHLPRLETLDMNIVKEQLHVTPFPEDFSFPPSLKKLNLRGCMLPWGDMKVVGSLPNLQVLNLRWRSFVGEEWEPKEEEFPKLKFLSMDSLTGLKKWLTEEEEEEMP